MNAPDFAAIIAGAIGHGRVQYLDRMDASAVINTRVLELCENADTGCPGCPDCPTIGRLLAIGAAVMTARMESPEGSGRQGVLLGGEYLAQSADRTIAYLRAVQP